MGKNDFLNRAKKHYRYDEWKNPTAQEKKEKMLSFRNASRVQQFAGYQMEFCLPYDGLAGSYYSRYRSLSNPEHLIYVKVVLCSDAEGARKRLLYALAEKTAPDIERVEAENGVAFEKKTANGHIKLWCEGNVFQEIWQNS